MDDLKSIYQTLYEYLDGNPLMHFIILVFGSVIAAKLADILFISFLSRLVKKTKSNIDDHIIETLHSRFITIIIFRTQAFHISRKPRFW